VIHSQILYNGQVCSAWEKLLCPGQLGLLSGWGVFTTLRVYDGVPFAFARHWARMSKDAALMHVPMPEDPAAIERDLQVLTPAQFGSSNGSPPALGASPHGSMYR
jgi:branched-subunit amino acid aminotransferase/4-amino-4-deoxychorismate lyase